MTRHAVVLVIAIILGVTCLAGCASRFERIAGLARASGFTSELVEGVGFRHRIYRNNLPSLDGSLHIYIEGDGSPYLNRTTPSPDPTPRRPMMLRLMRLDRNAAVYVGRPCYMDLANDGKCRPDYWTLARFSTDVVQSMLAVAQNELARLQSRSVELYGHSGGGALAVLLASRMNHVNRIVTIGGNLDVANWALLHRYAPLVRSLDPADLDWSTRSVEMLHLVGSADENVPPQLVEAIAARQGGRSLVIRGYTHLCCWEALWPQVLVRAEIDGSGRK